MKPITSSLALACLALAGGSSLAHAQVPPPAPAPAPAEKQVAFGVHGMVALPLGDFGNGIDAFLGVLASVDYSLQPQLELTGRTGYLHWLVKGDGLTVFQIPVWVGARYFLQPGGQGAFVHGESGINHTRATVDLGGQSGSDSNTEIALNLLGGFRQGNLIAEGGIYVASLDEAGDSLMFGGTVGTTF